ncbi:MAG TPA: polymer-forming cytoskeletal protein [Minicystis sp.]|nr:polymer-forming cytoskeletal protein [Minicystis sp.]
MHDVAVLGGSLQVYGTITGDALATGGSIWIHSGARVIGDVKAMGGSIWIEDGASVTGDVGCVGGSVHRASGAHVGGDVHATSGGSGRGHHKKREHARGHDDDAASVTPSAPESLSSRLAREAREAVTRTALLFVFGSVLIALLSSRMETLRLQIASRPMRTFATGILGVLAFAGLAVALCVTIVGIPFAVVGALLLFVATAAGVVSVLETAGCALFGHWTKNPYVHLVLGCVLFMLLGAIPFVGGFVKAAVVITGLGAIVATRASGYLRRRPRLQSTIDPASI